MTYTYDLGSNIGKVRLLIPDNVESGHALDDIEIQYFLDQVSTVNGAAIRACKWLARKYAQMATFSADGLSVQYGARASEYAARAKELEAELLGSATAVELERQDGYHEASSDGEYSAKIIYIKTR